MTMAKTLFILNDAPYGTERSHDTLLLPVRPPKREGEEIEGFLVGDAELRPTLSLCP